MSPGRTPKGVEPRAATNRWPSSCRWLRRLPLKTVAFVSWMLQRVHQRDADPQPQETHWLRRPKQQPQAQPADSIYAPISILDQYTRTFACVEPRTHAARTLAL